MAVLQIQIVLVSYFNYTLTKVYTIVHTSILMVLNNLIICGYLCFKYDYDAALIL